MCVCVFLIRSKYLYAWMIKVSYRNNIWIPICREIINAGMGTTRDYPAHITCYIETSNGRKHLRLHSKNVYFSIAWRAATRTRHRLWWRAWSVAEIRLLEMLFRLSPISSAKNLSVENTSCRSIKKSPHHVNAWKHYLSNRKKKKKQLKKQLLSNKANPQQKASLLKPTQWVCNHK